MASRAGFRRVSSAGLSLGVREHTAWSPTKQSVILVHGYPDQQDVWDLVIGSLPHDELHIVTYDVRGAGSSDVPRDKRGYGTELLVEDLIAVAEATVPEGRRFHLVGHDWGSIQLWDVVNAEKSDDRLNGRIASFTSISGPSLDHVAHLSRSPRGRRLKILRQLAHSWYVAAFHIPLLPELLWRRGAQQADRLLTKMEGPEAAHWGPELGSNAANGVSLYRANMVRRMRHPGVLRTDVPVLVIRPAFDNYVSAVLVEDLHTACSDLRIVDIDAGHWVICSHPGEVAQLVRDHIGEHR